MKNSTKRSLIYSLVAAFLLGAAFVFAPVNASASYYGGYGGYDDSRYGGYDDSYNRYGGGYGWYDDYHYSSYGSRSRGVWLGGLLISAPRYYCSRCGSSYRDSYSRGWYSYRSGWGDYGRYGYDY